MHTLTFKNRAKLLMYKQGTSFCYNNNHLIHFCSKLLLKLRCAILLWILLHRVYQTYWL